MPILDIEDSVQKIGSRFKLIIMAVKRSKALNQGATPLIESKYIKYPTIALEEISKGKIKLATKKTIKKETEAKEEKEDLILTEEKTD